MSEIEARVEHYRELAERCRRTAEARFGEHQWLEWRDSYVLAEAQEARRLGMEPSDEVLALWVACGGNYFAWLNVPKTATAAELSSIQNDIREYQEGEWVAEPSRSLGVMASTDACVAMKTSARINVNPDGRVISMDVLADVVGLPIADSLDDVLECVVALNESAIPMRVGGVGRGPAPDYDPDVRLEMARVALPVLDAHGCSPDLLGHGWGALLR